MNVLHDNFVLINFSVFLFKYFIDNLLFSTNMLIIRLFFEFESFWL